MSDNDIIEYFFYYKNFERLNHKKLKNIPNEIIEYLNNRFNDSNSLLESIVRIKYHIEYKPKCPICGKEIEFNNVSNNISKPFNKTCSNECNKKLISLSFKQTCLEKYGLDNISKLDNIKLKKKQTCKEHYGYEVPMQSPILSKKIHNTKIKKYGNGNNYQKSQLTKEQKYGDKNSFGFGSNEYKEILINKYGVDNISKLPEIKEKLSKKISSPEVKLKTYNTKKKNGTFNVSKPEDECYEILKSKYPDIKRQYRSELYPFNCDFYIPNLDLYIEYNGTWTHGEHPYNPNNIEDQNKVQQWIDKDTDFYRNAIDVWTIRDINKRNKAKENNLNYIEFWNIKEVKEWVVKNHSVDYFFNSNTV